MIKAVEGFTEYENRRGGKGIIRMFNVMGDIVFEDVNWLGIVELDPGSSIGIHTHEGEGELYHILEGHGKFSDNGKDEKVGPGSFCLIEPGQSHGLINTSNEDKMVLLACVYKSYRRNEETWESK